MNFALNARLTRSIQESFTCRKSTTWDRRLYFPSEGRCAEEFFAMKNPTASAGFEPANLGTKGQRSTSTTPKPLGAVSLNNLRIYCGCYSSWPSVNQRKLAVISSSAKVQPFVFLTDPDPAALNTIFVMTLSFWEEMMLGPFKRRQHHAHLSAENCLALWLCLSTCLFREVLKPSIK